MLGQPLVVRLRLHQVAIDIAGEKDRALLQISSNHLAALQPTPFADLFRRGAEYAVFAGDQQSVVGGDDILGRTQAVSVENAADVATVGQTDRRRTVPGFISGRCVLIEGAQFGGHVGNIVSGRGNQGTDRLKKIDPVGQQKLDHVVEVGAVADTALKDRHDALQFLFGKDRAFCFSEIVQSLETVPLNRVDFTVMGNHP